MRVITAKQSLAVLQRDDAGELERLAALAAFYQTAGLAAEDALSMYIAWSVWSHDKDQSMPNILARMSLRLGEPQKLVSSAETMKLFQASNKQVVIYARPFLAQMTAVPDEDLPKVFGIPWKPHPSVKLVPKDMLPMWNTFGNFIRGSIKPLLDRKGALLATCFNKIKHGPQIMIADPIAAGLARGFPPDQVRGRGSKMTVRLLLQGARVQETEAETSEAVRAGPFLPMDYTNMTRWFFQHTVHTAMALFIQGTWMYNATYPGRKRAFKPAAPEVQAIMREGGGRLERTFGISLR